MPFYFGEKEGDPLMHKINLRDISSRAKQWDHPIRGLLTYYESVKFNNGMILSTPKKMRETYCVSLACLAMRQDTGSEWWTNMPNPDPPDGLIATFIEEPNGIRGYMRQIEVVEHRTQPEELFDVLRNKLIQKSYDPDTVLVCLSLSPGIYNLKEVAQKLSGIKSTLKYVFVTFAGIPIPQNGITPDDLKASSTMVQLLPAFHQETIDLRVCLDEFKKNYDAGRELRLIKGSEIFYGTANKKFLGD